ncbi:MAG: ATP-grasp domain-containing protein, partial [Deltaproteobacteria bacterium]
RAFDKRIAKHCVARAGVPVADAVLIETDDPGSAARSLRDLLERHGRVVAKPVADGSSVGLFHVRGGDDVAAAAEAIAASGKAYLAEQFVDGTELTVGVVDAGNGPVALCASEVRLAPGRAFDFEGKYLGKGTVEITPAEVPEAVSRAAMDIALAAHIALGCEGYSRTDVIAGADGPVFLETNTLPGLTRASFLPQQLAVVGTSMRTFLEQQVALAVRRRDA